MDKLQNAYSYTDVYRLKMGHTIQTTKAFAIVRIYNEGLANEKLILKKGSIIRDLKSFLNTAQRDGLTVERRKIETIDTEINGKKYCIVSKDFQCSSKSAANSLIACSGAWHWYAKQIKGAKTMEYTNKLGRLIYTTHDNSVLVIDKDCKITINQCPNKEYNNKQANNFDELAIQYDIQVDFNEWTGSFEDNGEMSDFKLSEFIAVTPVQEDTTAANESVTAKKTDETEDKAEMPDAKKDVTEANKESTDVNKDVTDTNKESTPESNDKTVETPASTPSSESDTSSLDLTTQTKTQTTWDYNSRTAETIIPENMFSKTGSVFKQELQETLSQAIKDSLRETLDTTIITTQSLQPQPEHTTPPEILLESKPYTPEDFNNSVTLKKGLTLQALLKLLEIKHYLLFKAPPGTGKTTAAIALANVIEGETNSKNVEFVSFNQFTEYSDIVCGLRQTSTGTWEYEDGSLKKLCSRALQPENKGTKFIYIIDEINRGNPEAALGEYLTAMSKPGEYVKINNGDSICMPDNIYIIATMNTVDSSVSKLDAALRDRFAIVDMQANQFTADIIKPDASDELKSTLSEVLKALGKINESLAKDRFKGDENKIGMRQLYTNYTTKKELRLVIEYCIKPQIEIAKTNLDDNDISNIDHYIRNIDEMLGDENE
jgi:MoxR-like ATPase